VGCAERCGADRNRGHREDGGGRPGQEGWLVAVHDGSWSPPALFAAVESALDGRPDLERVQDALSDAEVEDRRKLALVGVLLEELWETLDPEERELALQAAVAREPFPVEELALARWFPDVTEERATATARAAERLVSLTLLTPTGADEGGAPMGGGGHCAPPGRWV